MQTYTVFAVDTDCDHFSDVFEAEDIETLREKFHEQEGKSCRILWIVKGVPDLV